MHFRLVRYFTLTSLIFFLLAGGMLGYFYREMALSNMLDLQETANVNQTRVFANQLWETHFVPLLADASDIPSPELKNLSRLQEIHRRALDLMRGSTTYKIKVYDPKGRTVYSSELIQIGEDKSGNAGFRGALTGETRTELVHKDKFSAFEQVVENRDLIQSYIPQRDPITGKVVGVFEIYSDVTPFLAEIRKTEPLLFIAVAAAFGTLYVALFLIVRRAERMIQRQAEERETTRQHLAQSEKMAALGQLVAGVAHQLNTPIAFSHNNVTLAIANLHDFAPGRPEAATVAQMLGDVLQGLEQMKELVENLRDFTRLDRNKVVEADLNATLHTVAYIARSAIPPRIRIVEDFSPLPPLECNASQLNQVFLNLITNGAEAIDGEGQVTVKSYQADGQVCIDVADDGAGIPDDVLPHIFDSYFSTKPKGVGTGLGLAIARDIVRSHGGDIRVSTRPGSGTVFTIALPLRGAGEGARSNSMGN
ncbi:MAG: sensor histidine kinase [Actinomycetota bacterium]